MGGNLRSWEDMRKFQDTMIDCSLGDLGWNGYPYTWTNGRLGEHNIQERIDRFLANEEWRNSYPHSKVQHLPRIQSDHAPIIIRVLKDPVEREKENKRKIFRFEHMWTEHRILTES